MQLDQLLATLGPLLDHSADLSPAARAAWLAELRLTQPVLAAEVEALLASEASMADRGFLRPGVAGKLLWAAPAGGQVGPYALVRPLGHGGMGSVWLGQRNDGQYEGQVAVKLLSGALLHPAGMKRFHREANALARLTHPNIARLIDAGVSSAGQSYLVLEYVDGVRIDEFCDAGRLSPTRRLDLFRQVLAAAAHAHASLIVHRDIKPSNILVTGDGTAKLLDFGIARLLESGSDASADAALTETGRVGTPGFAAPEQLTGGPITAATDVYALGVLLYMLLAGRHPTGGNGGDSVSELRRIVEADPIRLSVPIGADAASARGMSPDRLRRLYAGDLENILGKALEKAPERRYPTVAAFNADLDRFERHEAVEARPVTLRYRARKFVRRNRVAVTASIVAVSLLLATTGYALYQLDQARRQRDEARIQRDRAVFERQRSAASDNFMQAVLSTIGSSEQISAGELLRRGRALLETESGDDPRFVAPLMLQLASQFHVVAGQAGLDAERDLLQRGAGLARANGDAQLEATAECRLALFFGRIENDSAAALAHWQSARRLLRGMAPDPAVVASCLLAEAYSSVLAGRHDAAVVLLQRFDSVIGGAADSLSMTTAQHRFDASDVWLRLGRYRAASTELRRGDALLQRLGRSNSMLHLSALTQEYFYLNRFGEFRAADSVNVNWLDLAGRRGEDLAAFIEVHAASHATRAGRPDSAVRIWRRRVARARRDGTFNEGTLVPLIAALTAANRFSEAHAELAGYARLPAASVVRLLLLRGRLAEAEGNVRQARNAYDSLLAALRLPHVLERLSDYWYVVWRDGRVAFLDGDIVAADSLAQQALVLAHQYEQDDSHSAHVGQIRLLQAKIALARHDSSSAEGLLRLATPPLDDGLGRDQPEAREARALGALLGAR